MSKKLNTELYASMHRDTRLLIRQIYYNKEMIQSFPLQSKKHIIQPSIQLDHICPSTCTSALPTAPHFHLYACPVCSASNQLLLTVNSTPSFAAHICCEKTSVPNLTAAISIALTGLIVSPPWMTLKGFHLVLNSMVYVNFSTQLSADPAVL